MRLNGSKDEIWETKFVRSLVLFQLLRQIFLAKHYSYNIINNIRIFIAFITNNSCNFYTIICFSDEQISWAKSNYCCNDPSIWLFIRNSRINLVCFRAPRVIIDFWISCSARCNRPRAFKWQRQYRWKWQRRDTTTTIFGRGERGCTCKNCNWWRPVLTGTTLHRGFRYDLVLLWNSILLPNCMNSWRTITTNIYTRRL